MLMLPFYRNGPYIQGQRGAHFCVKIKVVHLLIYSTSNITSKGPPLPPCLRSVFCRILCSVFCVFYLPGRQHRYDTLVPATAV